MSVEKIKFGQLPDGRQAHLYKIKNQNSFEVCVTDFGVNIVSIFVRNRYGERKDVALGFDCLEDYFVNDGMFGATVGRNVNRISNAQFEIDGKTYHVPRNRGKHNIHSDKEHGFHKVLWDAEMIGENAVRFTYVSPDGEQGFPGELKISVLYTVTEGDGLIISYHAVSDQKTLINPSNHNYFNLDGHDGVKIEDTEVQILADYFTPVDPDVIPTGEMRNVAGTPMDFRERKSIGKDLLGQDPQLLIGKGYDHNFVIRDPHCGVRKMAEAFSKRQGILMEVYSDLPGLQFYSGNTIKEICGKGGTIYKERSGFCMEPQYFPNSINTKTFDAPVFDAGETYQATVIYQFALREEMTNDK
ncbi:MAG TPA: galactose mutarotase [Candidatus Anaerostipes excrementavium]|uniref:Aldose 1-epimerase n=1 Tax=Candidatus Anaerostipes excrementavium TaxID=2838463 RepID=A0A9D2B9J8_9FIRM|nr:aldose epimerase family protein [uncultured Anaerostipes sp.]HIX67317.1 galactose mutarotase [Candidatus Anaerostipes excrementavium]